MWTPTADHNRHTKTRLAHGFAITDFQGQGHHRPTHFPHAARATRDWVVVVTCRKFTFTEQLVDPTREKIVWDSRDDLGMKPDNDMHMCQTLSRCCPHCPFLSGRAPLTMAVGSAPASLPAIRTICLLH
eukprot:1160925-Pelagomonas_calceolata.AAC.9